jgi:hypothetical protein
VFSDGESFPHPVEALDGVLRRLGRHGALVADRPDGDGRLPGQRPAAAGGGRCGQALRGDGRDLPGQPAAAQGRRRSGDPLRGPVVVAQRAGVDPGAGSNRLGPLVRRGRRPPPAGPEHGR